MSSVVRITVVTFRRPALLVRALSSIQAQTYTPWTAEVLNDDPDDTEPARIVRATGDPRISLSCPVTHRGASENLNQAFRAGPEPYAAILEDDNWWEPDFLSSMVRALDANPQRALITANERIWEEGAAGTWRETGETLRPNRDRVWEYLLHPPDKCGGAMIANSAMLFRTTGAADWRTPPGIPVDVTEHYRERKVPHPFLVHDRVLVNFSKTRTSHRSQDPAVWTVHQVLLVGSVFESLPSPMRQELAQVLMAGARASNPMQRTALLLAGRFVPAAESLWRVATAEERLSLIRHLAVRWRRWARYRRLCQEHRREWTYLLTGCVAEALRDGAKL